MSNFYDEDLIGHVYGHLTVVDRKSSRIWNCLCDCGNMIEVSIDDLKHGKVKSCGHLSPAKYGVSKPGQGIGKVFGKYKVLLEFEVDGERAYLFGGVYDHYRDAKEHRDALRKHLSLKEVQNPPQKAITSQGASPLPPGIKRVDLEHGQSFQANINVNNDTVRIGAYHTAAEAVAARGAYLKALGMQHVNKSEQDKINLRKKYDEKRVDDVAMQLFKGEEPRKDSTTGYRGVRRYYTRKSREERFKAELTVKGKVYRKFGFLTAKDAYYNGRLELEAKHLPHTK